MVMIFCLFRVCKSGGKSRLGRKIRGISDGDEISRVWFIRVRICLTCVQRYVATGDSPRGNTQNAQNTFLGPVALLSSLATFNPGDSGLV